jgi:hypothetical protein
MFLAIILALSSGLLEVGPLNLDNGARRDR